MASLADLVDQLIKHAEVQTLGFATVLEKLTEINERLIDLELARLMFPSGLEYEEHQRVKIRNRQRIEDRYRDAAKPG